MPAATSPPEQAGIAFRVQSLYEPPKTVSWGAWEAIDAAARRLRGLGVRPGDRVLLVLPTSADFVHFFWGILRAGATPVPAYPPAGWRQLAALRGDLAAPRVSDASAPGDRAGRVAGHAARIGRDGLAPQAIVAPQDIWEAAPAPDLPRRRRRTNSRWYSSPRAAPASRAASA